MTKRRLRRILFAAIGVCALVLIAAAVAKFSGLPGGVGIYDYLRDMSLVVVTAIAAYLAHVFQKRTVFLQSLREEWHEIVDTKSALVEYCEHTSPTMDDFQAAFLKISRAIDYMRIVYANVGETTTLIGRYPYEPLHDMRRAIQSIDPRNPTSSDPRQRARACTEIFEAFNALRESFLNEFELDAPTNPIIEPGSRRKKNSGHSER